MLVSSFQLSLSRAAAPSLLLLSRSFPNKSYPCPLYSPSFSLCLDRYYHLRRRRPSTSALPPRPRPCLSSMASTPLTTKSARPHVDDSDNPLLVDFEFPPFASVEPRHVRPGIRSLLHELESDLEELEHSVEPTWEKLVEPLEKIVDRLAVVWGMVNHLKAVKDSEELRSAIDEVQEEKVKFQLKLGQSKPVYGRRVECQG